MSAQSLLELLNAIDDRSKRLLVNIYRPDSGSAFEAVVNYEMRDIFNTLKTIPIAPANEDSGSHQLREVLVELINREAS